MLWRKQGRRDSRSDSIHVENAHDSKGNSIGIALRGCNLCPTTYAWTSIGLFSAYKYCIQVQRIRLFVCSFNKATHAVRPQCSASSTAVRPAAVLSFSKASLASCRSLVSSSVVLHPSA